ncbi:MAG TPA: carbohydrate binding domain-containing protein [Candidatus Saccharimonadales bacterium]|nr:carbohydrate binding domain-containing protein [Candidatus Saccharimonadales bacterium]
MPSHIGSRTRVKATLLALTLGLAGFLVFSSLAAPKAQAAASTYLNFQMRLLTSAGGIVPDGNYNVEFKIYSSANSTGSSQGSCSGDANCLWVETRTSGNAVRVVNGYLSANLGSVTAFGSINWDQQMWLGVRIGGTGSPSWESIELTSDGTATGNKIQLTSVPSAFTANKLATGTGSSRGTLSFASLGQATSITLPDPGAGSATVCYQTATACGFEATSGTDFIRNQTSLQSNANFNFQSAALGSVGGIIRGASGQTANLFELQTNTPTTVFSVSANGEVLVASPTDSIIAFQVQNSASKNVFQVDAGNGIAVLGNSGASGLTGQLKFDRTNQTGSITLSPANPSSTNYALTLPAENGTICSTGSVCTGYQASGSYANTALSNLASVAINTSLLPGSSNSIDLGDGTHLFRTGYYGTSVVTPSVDLAASGTLSLGTGNATTINIGSGNTITTVSVSCGSGTCGFGNNAIDHSTTVGSTSGTSLTTIQSGTGGISLAANTTVTGSNTFTTGTGNVSLNGNTTVASNKSFTANGAATFEDATNSTNAFQIQNQSAANLFNVDSINARIGVDNSYSAMSAPSSLTSTASSGGSLTNAGSYRYEVTALDSARGETGVSNEPAACTTSGANLSCTLSWTAVTGASGYRIYRTANSGGSGTEKYLASAITNSYIDTGSFGIDGSAASPPSSNTAYTSTNNSSSALQVSIGGNGKPTGQLYVSGTVPSSYTGWTNSGLSHPRTVQVQGRYAYVMDDGNGSLHIFDLSNPANPVKISSVTGFSANIGAYAQGNYIYATDRNNVRLRIIDVSNPASPTVVSNISTGLFRPYDVYVQGRYAYVVDVSANTMVTFDVSNPASPTMVSTISGSLNGPQDIYVQGRYAYIANGGSSLTIIDVSNPANPTEVSNISTGLNNSYGVYVQGRYAYVSNWGGNSLVSFDVSNPASPSQIGSIGGIGNAEGVYLQGRYAYVASNSGGTLNVVDVYNPYNLVSIGTVSAGLSNPQYVWVNGRYAYVTSYSTSALVTYDMGGAYTQQLEAGGAEVGTLQIDSNGQVAGDFNIQGGLSVGQSLQANGNLSVTGSSYYQGAISLAGGLSGGTTINALSTPSAPTITCVTSASGCTTSTNWSYKITAVSASGGETAASGTTSISASDGSTLNSTTYNHLTWSVVTGAVSYKVYRITAGGTPSTTGLIGTVRGLTLDDTGLAGDASSAPTTDSSGNLTVNGAGLFKNTADTTTAFQVQNSGGNYLLNVDTSGNTVSIGDGTGNAGFTFAASGGTAVLSLDNNGVILATSNIFLQGNNTHGVVVKNGSDVTGEDSFQVISSGNAEVFGVNGNDKLAKVFGDTTLKAASNGTTTLQVQNTSAKNILSVDTSGGIAVLGNSGASGVTGDLKFNFSGQTGSISLVPLTPSSTAYTLNLPAENGTLCSTGSVCTGYQASGSYLAKNATDTSSAAAGAGTLYSFTNSSSASTGTVLSLSNGTNTGNTLKVTASGNPSSGNALIFASNTNAAPTGNLIDLQAGASPTSKFAVDASGNLVLVGSISGGTTVTGSGNFNTTAGSYQIGGNTVLTSSALTFTAASTNSISAAASQTLNVTAHGTSTWQTDSGNLTVKTSDSAGSLSLQGGTGGISLQTAAVTSGTSGAISITSGNASSTGVGGDVTIDTGTTTSGTPTVNIGNTNAKAIQIGNSTSNPTVTISSGTGQIDIGTGAQARVANFATGNAAQTATVGSTASTSTLTLQAGVNGSNTTLGLQVASGGVIGVGSNAVANTVQIGTSSTNTGNTQAINIGNLTAAGITNVTIGAFTGATSGNTTIQAFGTLALQTAASGTINLGTNAVASKTINIGSVGSTAQDTTIHIADTSANSTQTVTLGSNGNAGNAVTVDAGTGANSIAIGNSSTSHSIAIGAGATSTNTSVITIGSNNAAASTVTVQGGNSSGAVSIQSATSGTINIATANAANTVQVGNTANAIAQTINIGNNATASSTDTIVIGNLLGTSATTIQGGTGASAISITQGSGGTITIGATGTTSAVSIQCGTGTCGFGNNSTDHSTVLGSTSGTSATTIQSGSGNINLNAATVATNQSTLGLFNSTATTVTLLQAATSISMGATTGTFTVRNANTTLGNAAGSGVLTNNGATLNSTLALGDLAAGSIGSAASTVDIYTSFSIAPTASARAYTIPTPTASTSYGRTIYIANIAAAGNYFTIAGIRIPPGSTGTLIWSNTNGGDSWQFAGAGGASIENQNTADQTADFRISGTGRANTSFTTPLIDSITGGLNVGTTTATGVTIGGTTNTSTITLQGAAGLSILLGNAAGFGTVTNNGATVNTTLALGDLSAGSIGSAASTVNIYSSFSIAPSASGRAYTIPTPTASTTYGRTIYIANIAATGNYFTISGIRIPPGSTGTLVWSNTNGGASWQFAGAGGASIENQNTSDQTADFRISGSGQANTSFTSALFDSVSGALSVGTSTATGVTIGGTTNTTSFTVQGAASATYTIGTSNNTGGITLGNSTATNTIAIGASAGNGNTQTINIGTSATSGSTTRVNIGSSIAGYTQVNGKLGVGTSSTPNETLQVNGAINIGTTTNTNAGTIRWTGTDFEGYNGSTWKSMTTQYLSVNPVVNQVKSSDQSVNNSTTLVSDTALKFSIGANETWNFRFVLSLVSAARTAGWKWHFDVPQSTTSCTWGYGDFENAKTESNIACSANQSPNNQAANNLSDEYELMGIIVNGSTAQTVTFQFAQASATVGNTTVQAGSFLQANRVLSAGDATLSAFVDDGNSFGATADLGTNDAYDLNLKTNGSTIATFSQSNGSALFKNSSNSTTGFQIQNTSGNNNLFLADTTNNNLVGNASFETDTTNWAINTGSGSVSSSSTAQIVGNKSLAINTSATTNAGAKYDTATLLSSSTNYALSFWARSGSGTVTIQAGRADNDTFAGESTCTLNNSSATTTWARYSCTFTTSTVTTGGYIFIRQSDSTARTPAFYVDGVLLESGSTVNSYYEGKLQFNGTVTNPVTFKNQADTTTGLQVQNSSGTAILTVDTSNANVIVGSGSTGETAGELLVLDSDSNSTFNAGTATNAPSTVINGAMFYSASDHNFMCGQAGSWLTCNGLLYSNTSIPAGNTIASCTTACAAFNSAAPIPANYCQAGRAIHIMAKGHWSNTNTPTLGMSVYYGTDATTRGNDTKIGVDTPAIAGANGASNQLWSLDFTIICFSTTSMNGQGIYNYQTTAASTTSLGSFPVVSTTSTTVTSTTAKNLYIYPTWGASASQNTVTLDQLIVTGN